MVGFFTYRIRLFFRKHPNTLPDDVPLAHFILPGQLFIFDNVRHTLTLCGLRRGWKRGSGHGIRPMLETLPEMKAKLGKCSDMSAGRYMTISALRRGRAREIPRDVAR